MKNKTIPAIILGVSIFGLSGCSIAGIKVVEKSEVTAPEGEQTSESKKTFTHAGYTFVQDEKQMYVTEAAPAVDSLEEGGTIVRNLVKGEAVDVLGIDETNTYAIISNGGEYIYMETKYLTDQKEDLTDGSREIVNKEALETAIEEFEVYADDEFRERDLAVVEETLKNAKDIYNSGSATQEEIDAVTEKLYEVMDTVEPVNYLALVEEVDSDVKSASAYEEPEYKAYSEKLEELLAYVDSEDFEEEVFDTSLEELVQLKGALKELPEETGEPAVETEEPTVETSEPAPQKPIVTGGLGIPYPSAPESVDIFDGVTFAILSNVNAEIAAPGKVYDKSTVEASEIASLKEGDTVKVLAIGTNDFARIETSDGKVGFIKSTNLKKK